MDIGSEKLVLLEKAGTTGNEHWRRYFRHLVGYSRTSRRPEWPYLRMLVMFWTGTDVRTAKYAYLTRVHMICVGHKWTKTKGKASREKLSHSQKLAERRKKGRTKVQLSMTTIAYKLSHTENVKTSVTYHIRLVGKQQHIFGPPNLFIYN